MDEPGAVIVLTTWPADRDPSPLADALVGERLAACVNVLPEMDSTYTWQGRVEHERERQVIIKTTRPRLDELSARLLALHPYDVPEFLVLPVDASSPAYLEWLRGATVPAPGGPQS